MRKSMIFVVMTALFCLCHGSILLAKDSQASDSQAVIERANHLRDLLDRLLAQSNHSSIQKALHDGGDSGNPLIAEALQLKSSGEELLADEQYLEAAVTLQAALDQVFQAIRADGDVSAGAGDAGARLTEAIAANDTFISAATRVVNGEPNGKAVDLLAAARKVRAKADDSAANGDSEAALRDLENSTRLAQQAIMSVRNGKVIERRP